MLVDSTVFIDYLKGKEKAREFLTNPKNTLVTSVIVVMEIIVGLGKKKKVNDFLMLLEDLNIQICHLSETISQTAFDLFINYNQKGLGIADSLIAATAICEKQKIATHNIKHFSPLKNLSCLAPY